MSTDVGSNGLLRSNLIDVNKLPAAVIAGQVKDVARGLQGAAPNMAEPIIEHIRTVQARVSAATSVYRPPDEAIRHSIENARFMRNETGIMECLESRQRATTLLNWHLEPEDERSTDQKELVGKLQDILERIPDFTEYRRNLLEALWFGRYAVQNAYQRILIKGKRYTGVGRWLPIHGDKLVFRFDDGSHIFSDQQVGIRIGAGRIPIDKKTVFGEKHNQIGPTERGLGYFLTDVERDLLVLHKHIIEDGAYEDPLAAGSIHGLGIRHRIYWTWYQMQECLSFLMEYLERSALGVEIWHYPIHNPAAEAACRKAAEERIGGGRSIVLVPRPVGEDSELFGVEHIEPGLQGAESLKDVIVEFFAHKIKRYILGQTLSSEAAATGLGSGVADAHLATLHDIIRYDARKLEETLTRDLVEPIKAFNFPEATGIHVRFVIATETDDVEGKLAAWKEAYEMGLELRAEDVSDMIGSSKPDEGDEVLSLQKQLESQQALAQPAGVPMVPGQQMPGQEGSGVPSPEEDMETLDRAMSMEHDVTQMEEALGVEKVQREMFAKFDESEHPRAEDGRFGDKPGDSTAEREGEPDSPSRQLLGTKRTGDTLSLDDDSPLPEHLDNLRIPPAWTDVRVASDPNADLLVTGFDVKGRKQSVYSASFAAKNAAAKFSRIRELQGKEEAIGKQNKQNLADGSEEAAVMELIRSTGLRPGSDRDTKSEKQAFGATTLLGKHVVDTEDGMRLQFTGKKGVSLDIPIRDENVARILRERAEDSGTNGRLFDTDDVKLRAYTKTLDGGSFKPKDFRTLRGTTIAANSVSNESCCTGMKEYKKKVKEVARVVAEALGNTPAIALQSYIDPTVFSKWRPAV